MMEELKEKVNELVQNTEDFATLDLIYQLLLKTEGRSNGRN